MKRSKLVFAILILMIVLPVRSSAWGMLGHRIVGGIAEHYLSPKARQAIKRLLGNESIAIAANWADFIKSDRTYDYLSPWHYINLPAGMNEAGLYDYLKNDTATDLNTRLNFVIKALKNKNLPKDKQAFYLKLLIHLVGDAHQPMHTARPGDRGGNDIKLYWFSVPTNLHRVWDEHLVDYQQLSYTEYISAINFPNYGEVSKWQKQPVKQWIYESYQIAGKLYTEVKAEDKLTYPYNFYHVSILNQQLLKGGVRLAGLLNEIYER